MLVILGFIAISTTREAWPAFTHDGLRFFTSTRWAPSAEAFGSLPFVYGTIVTTVVAVVIATPIAVGAAIFLTEFAPRRLRGPVAYVIELLAYIPSIVYGLWAIFVLVPVMRNQVEPALQNTVGRLPIVGQLFSGPPIGLDLLTGGVVLAIMILPILTAVSREVLLAVPPTQREAMIGLGATHWEAVRARGCRTRARENRRRRPWRRAGVRRDDGVTGRRELVARLNRLALRGGTHGLAIADRSRAESELYSADRRGRAAE